MVRTNEDLIALNPNNSTPTFVDRNLDFIRV